MKTEIKIIFLSLIIFCSCKKQEQNVLEFQEITFENAPKLNKIIKEIEHGNRVESQYIGEGGSPSALYKKYKSLKNIATKNQLIALTDHKNSSVRCYAFKALNETNPSEAFSILLKHLTDTSRVITTNGCIGGISYVGDIYLNSVNLNSKQSKIIDSILFYDSSIILSEKYSVISNKQAISKNYQRLRLLVEKERNENALIILSKYKKQSDVDLISTFFYKENTQYSALKSAIEFSDEKFYPLICKIFENEWKQERYDYPKWKLCFQALAKYPKKHTLDLFERTVNTKDEFRYNTLCSYLLIAISKYPDQIYVSLKRKIKLDEFEMEEVRQELNSK